MVRRRPAAARPEPCWRAFRAAVAAEPERGTLTVVWHSIMRHYVPAAEWARVERELDRLAAAGTPEAPFAHVSFEPRRVGEKYPCRLAVRLGAADEVIMAGAYPNGLPAYRVPAG